MGTKILERVIAGAKFDDLLTDELIELEREVVRWVCRHGRGLEGWRVVREVIEERVASERRLGYFDF
jgi:hypothetical protein